jgi:hypothetical protein
MVWFRVVTVAVAAGPRAPDKGFSEQHKRTGITAQYGGALLAQVLCLF